MLRASRSALLQPSHASTEQRLACALWCAGRAWHRITDALSTPEAGQDPGDDGGTAT
jgi:hypothetical protein